MTIKDIIYWICLVICLIFNFKDGTIAEVKQAVKDRGFWLNLGLIFIIPQLCVSLFIINIFIPKSLED